MNTTQTRKITINVADPTAANQYPVKVPPNWTVEKLINGFKDKLKLPSIDTSGNPISYGAILDTKSGPVTLAPIMVIEKTGIKDGDTIRLSTIQEGGNHDAKTTKVNK